MKLKQILGALMCAPVLASTAVFPQTTVYAVSTFASATEFLADVVDVALTEINSPTKDTAIATTMTKFSVTGDEVFFNGTTLGYWDSSNSNTLYADAGKTTEIITETADGYEVKPSVLHTILNDVNSNIVENYVPTSTDWSKIIGKYDVTLGGVTIPADQWVTKMDLCPTTGDYTAPNSKTYYTNLSSIMGITGPDIKQVLSGTSIPVLTTWLIGPDGELYIGDEIFAINVSSNHFQYTTDSLSTGVTEGTIGKPGNRYSSPADFPIMRVALFQYDKDGNDNTVPNLSINFTDVTCTNANDVLMSKSSSMYRVDDPSIEKTCALSEAKAYGFLYLTGDQVGARGKDAFRTKHLAMLDSYSTSKRVVGNQLLARRLGVLTDLLATDTVEVKSNGWTVNGDANIDQYLGNQSLLNAGDTADISAVADIDALKFHVVVPTSLPIYVDDSNVTYVADNADIINKSGAAVKLTGVDIIPNENSGWTMVDRAPVNVLEGHEFKFDTTIELNRVLDISETYPFQYSAKLSPTAEATNSLELASVMVTVDWADTQQGG